MKDIIDYYRDIVIEIATPYSTGTGPYSGNPTDIDLGKIGEDF